MPVRGSGSGGGGRRPEPRGPTRAGTRDRGVAEAVGAGRGGEGARVVARGEVARRPALRVVAGG
eukprot:3934631-Rhodomonas_salina.1